MLEEKLVIKPSPESLEKFNQLSDTFIAQNELSQDLFSSFYLDKSVLKEFEEVAPVQWVNYYIIESLLGHYTFNDIHSFTKNHPDDAYFIVKNFIKELELLKKSKKIENFFINARTFLSAQNERDIKELKKDKDLLKIKNNSKIIFSTVMTTINRNLRKLDPLLKLTRGHDLKPISLNNISEEQIINLSERTQNFKIKEIIKIFVNLGISGTASSDKADIDDETADTMALSQKIFYLNDITQDNKAEYHSWLNKEIKKNKSYTTQLTAYIKAGYAMSGYDELERLAFSLNILEVARLENRILNVFISREGIDEERFIFKKDGFVEIFENENQPSNMAFLEGLITFIESLLSGPQPPKKKFSFSLNFPAAKKKPSEMPPKEIKFD